MLKCLWVLVVAWTLVACQTTNLTDAQNVPNSGDHAQTDRMSFSDAQRALKSRDYERAERILKDLSSKGHMVSQLMLGLMYKLGNELPQDLPAAACYLRMAADQGQYNAQFLLAELYAEGRGVPQGNIEALYWASLATGQGSQTGQ